MITSDAVFSTICILLIWAIGLAMLLVAADAGWHGDTEISLLAMIAAGVWLRRSR